MNGSMLSSAPPPRLGRWLTNRRMSRGSSKRAVGGHFHVAGVEAHLDVMGIAEQLSARKLDADDVGGPGALPEDAVIEGKFAHQIHVLDDAVADHELIGIGRRD